LQDALGSVALGSLGKRFKRSFWSCLLGLLFDGINGIFWDALGSVALGSFKGNYFKKDSLYYKLVLWLQLHGHGFRVGVFL